MKDKTGKMTDEQTKQYMGTVQTYYLKGKNYKSEFNGLLKVTAYFDGRDTIYTKMNGVNSIMYAPTNIKEEKVISYSIQKTKLVLLGYKCKLLEVKTNKGTHKYYFNKKIKVNYKYFKNHNMGLWNFFLEKSGGALALKAVIDLNDSYNANEVILIEQKEIDDKIFIFPNLPLIKMPKI